MPASLGLCVCVVYGPCRTHKNAQKSDFTKMKNSQKQDIKVQKSTVS